MNAFCAAVDWGTTSFRLWLLARDGKVLAERRSDEGMMAAREAGFEAVLERHLDAAGAPLALPVVICGMAGARQGWQEAAYVDAPARLDTLAAAAISVGTARRDVRILPGIAQRDSDHPDVMRGEETQLLGLTQAGLGDALVCLPGTHSKWVVLREGTVERFSTFMTGELYATIAAHTILRFAVEGGDAEAGGSAFVHAVNEGFTAAPEISRRLFGLRAAQLLGFADAKDATARLSGLLIGLELAGAAAQYGPLRLVVLLAGGRLARLYRTALESLDVEVRSVEADDMGRRGLLSAAAAIWGDGARI